MGDRKGQESDLINEAREFDYSPFLNTNLSFASPFIRPPPRSNYTERKWSKTAGEIFFFFISLAMRKEGTGKSNFHNFPLKQALKSRLTPPFSCRKLDTSTQVMKGTSPRTFAERNERTEIEG